MTGVRDWWDGFCCVSRALIHLFGGIGGKSAVLGCIGFDGSVSVP